MNPISLSVPTASTLRGTLRSTQYESYLTPPLYVLPSASLPGENLSGSSFVKLQSMPRDLACYSTKSFRVLTWFASHGGCIKQARSLCMLDADNAPEGDVVDWEAFKNFDCIGFYFNGKQGDKEDGDRRMPELTVDVIMGILKDSIKSYPVEGKQAAISSLEIREGDACYNKRQEGMIQGFAGGAGGGTTRAIKRDSDGDGSDDDPVVREILNGAYYSTFRTSSSPSYRPPNDYLTDPMSFECGYVTIRTAKGDRVKVWVQDGRGCYDGDYLKFIVCRSSDCDENGGGSGDGDSDNEKLGGSSAAGVKTSNDAGCKIKGVVEGVRAKIICVASRFWDNRSISHRNEMVCTFLDVEYYSALGEGGSLGPLDLQRANAVRNEVNLDNMTCCVASSSSPSHPYILIRCTREIYEFSKSRKFVAEITGKADDCRIPFGIFVRDVGKVGDREAEIECVLNEYDIPTKKFTDEVMSCLPDPGYVPKLTPDRVDLRDLNVVSIDPPGCCDIDDALHCRKLPNGNHEIGVHIADVSHYVDAGSKLDEEASFRCTSTYLVNKRLDMLPSLLTTDLCSLKSGVDRYAFTVTWEIDDDCNVVNVRFFKSIIHSAKSYTYAQAQGVIDDDLDSSEIALGLRKLSEISKHLRARRVRAGALTLASPEVKFAIDDDSLNPTDVTSYDVLGTNALVEEMMLLANVTVGKRVLRQYPTLGVLRRHPSPDLERFDGLISKANSAGMTIDPTTSLTLSKSLDNCVIEADPYVNKIVRILTTRCMRPAEYFCAGDLPSKEWHHFGLASPIYTHFTSPIRRYCDVLTHRLLAASIGYSPLPPHLASKALIGDLCDLMNRRHRSAQLAGRASVNLYTISFFEGNAKEEECYVTDVMVGDGIEGSEESMKGKDVTLSVIVPRYGVEGKVIAQSPFSMSASPHSATLQDGTTIKVFQKVTVRIFVVVKHDGGKEMKMEIVNGKKRKADPAAASRKK